MEGKLIKTDGTYILSVNEYKDEIFAIADTNKVHELNKHKLSLKNCEAIENGYDLDELTQTEWDVKIEMENSLTNGYKNQPDNIIGFIAEYKSVPKLDEDGCLILKRK